MKKKNKPESRRRILGSVDSWEKLGITRKYLADSLVYNNVITVIGLVVISVLGLTIGFKPIAIDPAWLAFYVIISVPIQELVFRGFVQTQLYRYGEHPAIAATAAIYALVHYYSFTLVLLTFFAGAAWGYAFSRRPNILGPIVSHAILGVYLFTFVL
jgi:membrane protease YdiL (CAAX protease family)